LRGHRQNVCAALFLPGGTTLVSGGGSDEVGEVVFWDVRTGRPDPLPPAHTSSVASLAYDADGRRLLSGSFDRPAILWDVTTRQKLRTFPNHDGAVTLVAFAPDGSIVTGCGGGQLRIWDANSATPRRTIVAHPGGILGGLFSPDGSRLYTCG